MHDQNNLINNLSALANPFQFSDHDIRTAVDAQGDVWFCAKDVFEALDIDWNGTGTSLKNYPENWFCTLQLRGQRGTGEVVFISEAAVYRVIFRSNKPEAEVFANWICEEVLPAIRKQGFFGKVDAGQRLGYSRQIVAVATSLAATKDAMLHTVLVSELRDLCNLIGKPAPKITLIGQNYRQMPLFADEENNHG